MRKTNLLIGVTIATLIAVGSQAHASNWSMNGSSCVPNDTSINDYFVTGGSVTHKANSTTLIILYCPVTSTWGSHKPDKLQLTYANSDPLIANITAQLVRLVASDGHFTAITNAHVSGSVITRTGLQRESPLFSHNFDFKNSYYYVRVDISRSDPSQFAKLFGVSLDCETCPAD
jgi:hypothetical protein